jgi:hypothetical protein
MKSLNQLEEVSDIMSKLKRREFLVGGATAVVGLTLFSKNVRATLSAAQQAGKPLLTEKSLNTFIKANSLRTQKGQSLSAEAARDINGFIQEHFYLTEAQRTELAALSAEDQREIADAIQKAREKKGRISVRITPLRASNAGSRQFATEANHPMPMRIKIVATGGYDSASGGWYGTITVTKTK